MTVEWCCSPMLTTAGSWWFASINIGAVQLSQSLAAAPTQLEPMVSSVHQRTDAAPVISVSMITYCCPPSVSITTDSAPTVVSNSATTDIHSASSPSKFTTHSGESFNGEASIDLMEQA